MAYVMSRGGKIGPNAGTTSKDLDALFADIAAKKAEHLIVHFHGGLVSESSGLDVVKNLEGRYAKHGYPVFFVWRSGILDALRQSLAEAARERGFKQTARKVAEWLAKKAVRKLVLGEAGPGASVKFALDGAPAIASAAGPTAGDDGGIADSVTTQFDRYWQAPREAPVPLDGLADQTDDFLALDESEILADLHTDAAFQAALAELAATNAPVDSGVHPSAAPLGVKAPLVTGGPVRSALADALLIPGASTNPAIGIKTFGASPSGLFKAAAFIYKVGKAVIKRVKADRHHEIYPTVIEETLRHLKLGDNGLNEWAKQLLWDEMKNDTGDAFREDGNSWVGTEFLRRLALANSVKRITLVGHSTGAIYIANWLEAARRHVPNRTFEVIYLAPAITYEAFNRTLARNGDLIARFRLFGMQDSLEKVDQVWGSDQDIDDGADIRRFVYPCSLLYLVSGLLESKAHSSGKLVDEPDMPILGMARFFDRESTFNAQSFPEVAAVRSWLRAQQNRTVWSITPDIAAPGCQSGSPDHGDFDNDARTVQSVEDCLQGIGWQ